jgi:cytochrome c-type biogenesis protein CcmF
MGLAPLFGWRKTSTNAIRRAFVFPVAITFLCSVLHVTLGAKFGIPAIVAKDATTTDATGLILQKIASVAPGITLALAAFNLAVVLQEFYFGIRARRAATKSRGESEGLLSSLVQLISKSRRRYGGYVVHVGITCMYVGFVGTVWSSTKEVSLSRGESVDIAGYRLEYRGSHVCPGSPSCSEEQQSDTTKRMFFADLDVIRGGKKQGSISPAKFIYQRGEGMTTTEVGLWRSFTTDLYVVLGTTDSLDVRAALQIHGNPFVSWVWIGIVVLVMGASISLWPEVSLSRLGAWRILKSSAVSRASIGLALVLSSSVAQQHGFVSRDAKNKMNDWICAPAHESHCLERAKP